MDDLTTALSAWLVTYLLHSTLLLGGAWLFSATVRRAADEIREAVWKAALVGGVVTATLQVVVGVPSAFFEWTIPQRFMPTQRHDMRDAHADRTLDEDERTISSGLPFFGLPSLHDDWLVADAETSERDDQEADRADDVAAGFAAGPEAPVFAGPRRTPDDESRSSASPDDVAPTRAAWRTVLPYMPTIALGCGALAFVVLLACRRRFIAKLTDRCDLTDGPLPDMLNSLRRRGGIRRRVRLTCSKHLTTPIAFGVLRPEICLPERALPELDADQQETMLAHELAHHRAGDPFWLAVAQVIEHALLVQPLNRLARARLQELAEYRCDAWAVEQTGRRVSLARCLTDVASWMIGPESDARHWPLTAMALRESSLRRRVQRVLSAPPRRTHAALGRCAATCALLVVAGAATVLPGVRHAVAKELRHATESTAPEHTIPAGEVQSSSTDDVGSLSSEMRRLDDEIAALESEIAAFGGALHELGDDEFVAPLVSEIESKLNQLGARRDRVAALSRRISPNATASPSGDEQDDASAAENETKTSD
jgi:beta-lactamase regulating signal transducer with metallopeptidase domain